jgi:ABC-type anion transport system duplicated permease subunit
MSLKAIHLIFVNALTALSFGCAIWKFMDYRSENGATGDLLFCLAALVVGVLVIIYGRYFLKKMKKMSYL